MKNAGKIKVAKSFFDKSMGMILASNKNGILIKTRFGVHTFFMKYPIDVFVLDAQNKVVQIKRNLKPNRIFLWSPKFSKILELRSDKSAKIGLGDILNLKN